MNTLMNRMRVSLRARNDYRRTVRELRRLPLNTALDLDIYQPDAPTIARRAVYGA